MMKRTSVSSARIYRPLSCGRRLSWRWTSKSKGSVAPPRALMGDWPRWRARRTAERLGSSSPHAVYGRCWIRRASSRIGGVSRSALSRLAALACLSHFRPWRHRSDPHAVCGRCSSWRPDAFLGLCGSRIGRAAAEVWGKSAAALGVRARRQRATIGSRLVRL